MRLSYLVLHDGEDFLQLSRHCWIPCALRNATTFSDDEESFNNALKHAKSCGAKVKRVLCVFEDV